MNIREADTSDCVQLKALSRLVWLDTYGKDGVGEIHLDYLEEHFTEHHFLSYLSSPKHKLLLCDEGQKLSAYIQVNFASRYLGQDLGYEIERIYVHPHYQRKGLGRQLLSEVFCRYGKQCWLYSWIENQSNGFYQRLGFEWIGRYDFQLAGNDIANNVWAYPSNRENEI